MRTVNRKRTLAVSLPILLFLLCLPLPAFAGELKVTRVVDGDTINVRGGSAEMMIRLVGIDAPELSHKKRKPGQPFSQKSTKHLVGMVLNKNVTIKEYGHDRYGRTLAVVFLDGKSVNLEMVKSGFAEVYRGEHAKGFDPVPYLEAEKRARAEKKEMWTQGDKYVSPRNWRRAQREEYRLEVPIGCLGKSALAPLTSSSIGLHLEVIT